MDQKKWIVLKSYIMSDKFLAKFERKDIFMRFRKLDLFERVMKLQTIDEREAQKLFELCTSYS